ncbi:MAG: hypothetical protein OEM01_12395 [Desulfobulbaceae bacterium]|nr:hypothetical protein [Desulfobulbaceae bacterium]
MKNIKQIQILLLSVLMCFVFANPSFSALSTQTTSDVDIINVDKNAPGTKLSGPLTIYFANYDSVLQTADMYVFLRLRKGYDLYAFSTIIPGVAYTASNIDILTDNINDFIENNVLPEIYGGVTPPYAIKSTDQIVQDDPLCNYCPGPPAGEHMNFTIMDIVIAVQD